MLNNFFNKNRALQFFITSMVIFSIFNLYGENKPDSKTASTVKQNYKISVKKYIDPVINSDVLRFTKGKKGKVIELVYGETVLENKGTPDEKVCICMANAYRAAQIVSNVWSDGIFRTGDIKEIRTGWNTEGPFEMFEEVMGIPEEKIKITGSSLKKATPGDELTIKDLWFEFTFNNGQKLFIDADLFSRVLSEKFLELRSKFKKGDQSVQKELGSERKIAVEGMACLPFKALIVKKKTKSK